MKVLLDIKDDKAPYLLEVLRDLSYVKIQPLSDKKALLLKEIKEAVETVNKVRAGKLKARPIEELLKEL